MQTYKIDDPVECFNWMLTWVDKKLPGYAASVAGWHPTFVTMGSKRIPSIQEQLWNDAATWCAENIGERGPDWRIPFDRLFIFRKLDDAILFKLAWG